MRKFRRGIERDSQSVAAHAANFELFRVRGQKVGAGQHDLVAHADWATLPVSRRAGEDQLGGARLQDPGDAGSAGDSSTAASRATVKAHPALAGASRTAVAR